MTMREIVGAAVGAGLIIAAAGLGRATGTAESPSRASTSLPTAGDDTFTVDGAHSSIVFKIRHVGLANFYGKVNAPSGSFRLDPEDLAHSFVKVDIEIKNVDGGNEARNRFLMSPDLFNAREYPTATFESTSIAMIDEQTFKADGSFTLRGVSKPMSVTLEGVAEGLVPRFGYRCGMETVFTIDRTEFGMNSHLENDMLGKDVTITVALEGVVE